MKKIIVLALVLLLALATIPAFADDEHKSGLFTYDLKKNGTVVITGYDWNNSKGDVIIPATIDGYSVVAIDDYAFQVESGLSSSYKKAIVTIPDSIISIGKCAFINAPISSINIPNSIQSIGDGAFCQESFQIRPFLQFRIDPNHPNFAVVDGCLYNKKEKKLLFAPKVGVNIPEGILAIGDYVFKDTYPSAVDKEEYKLPSTLISIGDYAFADAGRSDYPCPKLEIPKGTTTIGSHAFEGFEGTVVMDATLIKTIPDYAFYYAYLDYPFTPIEIANPEYIESIGVWNNTLGHAFIDASCFSPSITTIPTGFNPATSELPDTITTIESKAFIDWVDDLKLPSSITSIAEDAFPQGSTFIVEAGSYAQRWADENGFTYTVEGQGNLDWLNN